MRYLSALFEMIWEFIQLQWLVLGMCVFMILIFEICKSAVAKIENSETYDDDQ